MLISPGNEVAGVDSATRQMRRVRAEQLDLVHSAISEHRWSASRFRSPTAWLVEQTKESPGSCRTTLMLSERIQEMPVAKAVFAEGDLAESALRLLAETWHSDIADTFARDEEMLVGWAQRLSFKDLRVVLDTWRMHADPDREERTNQEQFDARKLHLSSLLDGMGQLDALLDPEGFLLVQEAILALAQRSEGDQRTPAQRRADALVSLAKFFLKYGGTPTGKKRRQPRVVATINYEDLIAAEHDTGSGGGDGSGSGSATGVTGSPKGAAIFANGSDRVVVTPDMVHRLACDSGLHRLIVGPAGHILDYGRQTRTVSDALFETLALRDHGCRWKGCTAPVGVCDAHHAKHWGRRGKTEPDNLVLLCWYHHHLLHEQHWSMKPLGAGHFQLTDPTGIRHDTRPPLIGGALPQLLPLSQC